MNFVDSVKTCFAKYADFSGRATRSEYWWFVLFQLILLVVAQLIHPYVYLIAALGLFLPGLSAAARRLHDIGKSGWFLLLGFIPLVNFYVLYLLVLPSQPESNEYGPPPAATT